MRAAFRVSGMNAAHVKNLSDFKKLTLAGVAICNLLVGAAQAAPEDGADGQNGSETQGAEGGAGGVGVNGAGRGGQGGFGIGSTLYALPNWGAGLYGGNPGEDSSDGGGAGGTGNGSSGGYGGMYGGGGGGGISSGGGGASAHRRVTDFHNGGSGGGGGALAFSSSMGGALGSTTGGKGGKGGDGVPDGPGAGGGGGGGGIGAELSLASFSLDAGIEIHGGAGGAGGDAVDVSVGAPEVGGGGGGAGAHAVSLMNHASLENAGSIFGGAGGNGGISYRADGSTGGMGGAGVYFSSSSLINHGIIQGGKGGGGGASYGRFIVGDIIGLFAWAGGGSTGGDGVRGSGNLDNTHTIQGGDGGKGGERGAMVNSFAGRGGTGGVGVQLTTSESFNNSGTIKGGSGGLGGVGEDGRGGVGGEGVKVEQTNLNNSGTIEGGRGGDSGTDVEDSNVRPGRGGKGGVGLTASANSQITNENVITGGDGGNVGRTDKLTAAGEDGGIGGAGVVITDSVLYNHGTIAGGKGGIGLAGDSKVLPGQWGAGGVGISASNVTLVSSGTIRGGMNGNDTARAAAIIFTGGTNTLELHAGWSIAGKVTGTGHDKVIFGGAGDSSFNATTMADYTGIASWVKKDSSAWTITGTTTVAYDLSITGGAIEFESPSAMVHAQITVANASLSIRALTGETAAEGSLVVNNNGGLVNFGILQGMTAGTFGGGVVVSETGGAQIVNYGTIRERTGHSAIVLNDGGTVDNFGRLESFGLDHSLIVGSKAGSVHNYDEAVIQEGVFLDMGGSVNNGGQISSSAKDAILSVQASADVINTGTLTAARHGVLLQKGGSVENSGLIEADSSVVRLEAGGTINNAEGGRILAGTSGLAVDVQEGDTVLTNNGMIAGNVQMSFSHKHIVTLQLHGNIQGDLRIGNHEESELILGGTVEPGGTSATYSSAVTGQTTFRGVLRKKGSQTWTLDRSLNTSGVAIEQGTLNLTSSLDSNVVDIYAGSTLWIGETGQLSTPWLNVHGELAGAAFRVLADTTVAGHSVGRISTPTLEVDGHLIASGVTIGGDVTVRGILQVTESTTFEKSLTLLEGASTSVYVSPEVAVAQPAIVADSVLFNGELSILITGLVNEDNREWLLFDSPGLSGTFEKIGLGGRYNLSLLRSDNLWTGEGGGYAWTFDQQTGSLRAEAVPEPSTWMMLGAGAATACLLMRRRRLVSSHS